MHTLIHFALKIILIAVIASLFTLAVSIRPAGKKLSRRKLIKLFVVGAVIGAIFLTTQSLYEVTTAL